MSVGERLDEGGVTSWCIRLGSHLLEEVAVEGLDERGVGDSRGLSVVIHQSKGGD